MAAFDDPELLAEVQRDFVRLGAAEYIDEARRPLGVDARPEDIVTALGGSIAYVELDVAGEVRLDQDDGPHIHIREGDPVCQQDLLTGRLVGKYYLRCVLKRPEVNRTDERGLAWEEAFRTYFARRLIGEPECLAPTTWSDVADAVEASDD